MQDKYFEDLVLKQQDYTKSPLAVADYDGCSFEQCNFTNTDLSGITFSDCSFVDCDLSNAKLVKTGFKDVRFRGCKLMGLHFEDCDPFLLQMRFQQCILNLSCFYQVKIPKTVFEDCSMKEVDLTAADVSQSLFSNCDLSGALFDDTRLEKSDLRTAFGYVMDPDKNKIRKARFSHEGVMGLLSKYDISIEP